MLEHPLQLLLAVQLLGLAREDFGYTAMIAVVHSCLRAETRPSGKVVSAVVIFVLLLATTACLYAQLEQHGRLMSLSCALSHKLPTYANKWVYGQPLSEA